MYYGWPVGHDWLVDISSWFGIPAKGSEWIRQVIDHLKSVSNLDLELKFGLDRKGERTRILSMCSTHSTDNMPHSGSIRALLPFVGYDTLGWYKDAGSCDLGDPATVLSKAGET